MIESPLATSTADQFFHQAAQRGHGQPPEVAELVKKTVQRPMPRGHLDIMLQLRRFLGQFEEIGAIKAQRLHRRAATHRSRARAAFGEGRFAEAVARLQRGEDDLIAALIGLHDARAPRDEHVKRISGVTLPDEKVAKLVILLLQERTQLFEMLVGQELKERRTAEEILVGRFHFVRRAGRATGYAASSGPKNGDRGSGLPPASSPPDHRCPVLPCQ